MTTILTTAKLAEALAPLIDSAHDAVDLTVAAGTPLVCDMLDGGASDQATVKQRWAGAIIKFGVEPSVTFGHVPTSGTFTKFSANEWSVKIIKDGSDSGSYFERCEATAATVSARAPLFHKISDVGRRSRATRRRARAKAA